MFRFAQALVKSGFADGATRYDEGIEDDDESRIILSATLIDGLSVQFVVDTGAPWSILAPEIAGDLACVERLYRLSPSMSIRGFQYHGWLCKTSIALVSQIHGSDLNLDLTVFVPEMREGEAWPFPNYLGMRTCLNFFRWAVDPGERAFYFGHP